MNNFFYLITARLFCALSFIICLTLARPAPALMELHEPTEKLTLPDNVSEALDKLLMAAKNGTAPDPLFFEAIIDFSARESIGSGNRILPQRSEGQGVFYYTPMPFSLADVTAYTMNPDIPAAAIFPNSVRRSAWDKNSLKGNWNFKLPATEITVAHGDEFEAITPDATSGACYSYTLKRLFALVPIDIAGKGKTAIIQVSIQDKESANGLKGAVLGPDTDWNYVYSNVQGVSLPLVGWAKTNIYGAATVNVWFETEDNRAYLCSYKWLAAGWSGLNMVRSSHINAGITRHLTGFEQVIGTKKRPAPEDIIREAAIYAAMSDAEQIAALEPFRLTLEDLVKKTNNNDTDILNTLANGEYTTSLSREEREAELIRIFVKKFLGMPPSSVISQIPAYPSSPATPTIPETDEKNAP